MIILFLDDERNIEDVTWIDYPLFSKTIVARNFEQFKSCFETLSSEELFVSFDHDISCWDKCGQEITGYTCLKWMIDYCFEKEISIPECFFHTKNIVGEDNMNQYYRNALKFSKE